MYAIQLDPVHRGYSLFTMPLYSARERGQTSDPTQRQPEQERPEDVITGNRSANRQRLMKLATVIEPDACRVSEWWTQTPIIELGSHTADELVARGMDTLVEKFLLTIIFGDRD
jgi:hypothetical protein